MSVKCERCARLGKKNCIAVSWEAVDRVMDSTTRQIEEEERKRKRAMEQAMEHEARIDRLRKTLKLAEQRSLAQAKCLSEQLDEEAAARGEEDESRVVGWEEFNIQTLAAMPNDQINWELGDAALAPLSAAEAPSSQGS